MAAVTPVRRWATAAPAALAEQLGTYERQAGTTITELERRLAALERAQLPEPWMPVPSRQRRPTERGGTTWSEAPTAATGTASGRSDAVDAVRYTSAASVDAQAGARWSTVAASSVGGAWSATCRLGHSATARGFFGSLNAAGDQLLTTSIAALYAGSVTRGVLVGYDAAADDPQQALRLYVLAGANRPPLVVPLPRAASGGGYVRLSVRRVSTDDCDALVEEIGSDTIDNPRVLHVGRYAGVYAAVTTIRPYAVIRTLAASAVTIDVGPSIVYDWGGV